MFLINSGQNGLCARPYGAAQENGDIMKYYMHLANETIHVHMEGAFTFNDHRSFFSMMKTLRNGDISEIHMFINKLEFIDSTALGLFMMAHDAAKKLHRPLVFLQPKGQVKNALIRAAQHNALNIAG